jgi:hypothetical protein
MKPPDGRNGRPGKETPASESAQPLQASLPFDGLPIIEHSVNPFFAGEAMRFILNRVAAGSTVIADDLYTAGIGRPVKPNSVGSIFAQLRRSGSIERVGFCGSRRNGRNGSAVGVWRKGGRR